jgi:hypothetical protein
VGPRPWANVLRSYVSGFQHLLLVVALGMLGAGLAMKFLPTGSHRTKDAAGQLIHNALILRRIGCSYRRIGWRRY